MSDSPLDAMREAVEKARRQGHGDIGKTDAVNPAEQSDDVDDFLELFAEQGFSATEPEPSFPEPPAAASAAAGSLVSEPAARAAAAGPRSDAPHPSELTYQRTRKVRLDPKRIARSRVIAATSGDDRVEVYRQLRSQVLNRMRKHGLRNFAITSAHEDAGKTLTAVNLAIAISQEVNQTVLLVDLDLNSPSVHETFGIKEGPGVYDHLTEDMPLEDILLDPGYPRLLLLPGRAVAGNLSELLTSPRMKAMFADITSRYHDRIVIFDLPPLLRNDDAMSFLPAVDACLFVVEDDVTTRAQIQRSMELLVDTKLLGTVLNKVV